MILLNTIALPDRIGASLSLDLSRGRSAVIQDRIASRFVGVPSNTIRSGALPQVRNTGIGRDVSRWWQCNDTLDSAGAGQCGAAENGKSNTSLRQNPFQVAPTPSLDRTEDQRQRRTRRVKMSPSSSSSRMITVRQRFTLPVVRSSSS